MTFEEQHPHVVNIGNGYHLRFSNLAAAAASALFHVGSSLTYNGRILDRYELTNINKQVGRMWVTETDTIVQRAHRAGQIAESTVALVS